MKKMTVLIVSEDRDYCINVSNYFKNYYNENTIIVYCNSLENLKEYIHNNNAQIVLCEPEFRDTVGEYASNIGAIYTIVDSNGSEEEGTVSKYISAPALYSELLFIYSRFAGRDKASNLQNYVPIYMFISPDSSGASTLSAAFSYNLASYGKRVLYIGLDGLSDYSMLVPVNGTKGMSDIIGSFKSSAGNVTLTARSVTSSGSVAFINGCKRFDDMSELNDQECEDVFAAIFSSGEYDAIVIDFSLCFVNLWNYAAKNANIIFAVAENSQWSIKKMNKFIDAVNTRDFRGGLEAAEKLEVIINRSATGQPVCEVSCPRVSFVPKYQGSSNMETAQKISVDRLWTDVVRR